MPTDNMKPNISVSTINSVIDKVHTNNVSVQQAGKSNVLVIESNVNLTHKTTAFLSDSIF